MKTEIWGSWGGLMVEKMYRKRCHKKSYCQYLPIVYGLTMTGRRKRVLREVETSWLHKKLSCTGRGTTKGQSVSTSLKFKRCKLVQKNEQFYVVQYFIILPTNTREKDPMWIVWEGSTNISGKVFVPFLIWYWFQSVFIPPCLSVTFQQAVILSLYCT